MGSKTKNITIIIIVLTYSIVFSQNRNTTLRNGVFNNNLDFFALQKVENIYNSNFYNNIKGRYYLYPTWEKCKLTNIDNKRFIAPCNYNLHTDFIEIKVDTSIYILDHKKIKEIQVNNEYLRPIENNTVKHGNLSSYYKELTNNKKINLIKRYNLSLQSVQSTTSLGLYETKLEIKEVLFFLFEDGKLEKVPKTNKKIREVLINNNIIISSKIKKLKKTENLISTINQI